MTTDLPASTPLATAEATAKTVDSVVLTMFVLLAAAGATQAALGGILPLIQRELELSHTHAQLHITAMSLGGASMSFMVDRLRRRFGRPMTLVAGALFVILGATGLIAGRSLWILLPAMVLLGWAMCIVLVIGQSMLVSRNPIRRDKLVASFNVVYALGVLVIVVVFPWLVSTSIGWRGVPWLQVILTAGIVLPMFVIVLRGRTDLNLTQRRPEGHGESTIRYPLLLTLALAIIVEWAIVFWLITYSSEKLNMSDGQIAQATLFLMSGFFAARVAGIWLLARLGSAVMLVASMFMATIAAVGALLTGSFGLALVVLTVGGFAAGNMYPAGISWVMSAHPGNEDKAMARTSLLNTIGTMIFPLLLGIVSDKISLTFAISMLLVVSIAATLATGWQSRRTSSRSY